MAAKKYVATVSVGITATDFNYITKSVSLLQDVLHDALDLPCNVINKLFPARKLKQFLSQKDIERQLLQLAGRELSEVARTELHMYDAYIDVVDVLIADNEKEVKAAIEKHNMKTQDIEQTSNQQLLQELADKCGYDLVKRATTNKKTPKHK